MSESRLVGGAAGARVSALRLRGSPAAVTRSELGSVEPPIPQRGLGCGLFELLAAPSPSSELERRRRLATKTQRRDPRAHRAADSRALAHTRRRPALGEIVY